MILDSGFFSLFSILRVSSKKKKKKHMIWIFIVHCAYWKNNFFFGFLLLQNMNRCQSGLYLYTSNDQFFCFAHSFFFILFSFGSIIFFSRSLLVQKKFFKFITYTPRIFRTRMGVCVCMEISLRFNRFDTFESSYYSTKKKFQFFFIFFLLSIHTHRKIDSCTIHSTLTSSYDKTRKKNWIELKCQSSLMIERERDEREKKEEPKN